MRFNRQSGKTLTRSLHRVRAEVSPQFLGVLLRTLLRSAATRLAGRYGLPVHNRPGVYWLTVPSKLISNGNAMKRRQIRRPRMQLSSRLLEPRRAPGKESYETLMRPLIVLTSRITSTTFILPQSIGTVRSLDPLAGPPGTPPALDTSSSRRTREKRLSPARSRLRRRWQKPV